MKRALLLLFVIANIQLYSQTTINEGFEGTTFPPTGWNIHSPAGNLLWSKSSSLKHSGNYSIYLPNWNCSYIVSPMVNITSDQDSLTFWTNYSVNSSTGILTVYASTIGQTFNDIPDTSNFIKREYISSSSNGWVRKTISLKNYIGQSIYITIKYDTWKTTMNIDDISISTTNSPIASTKAPTNVTQTSATLNGSYINFDSLITSKGFLWRNANNTNWDTVFISSDTLKHNLSNLTSDTKYEYKAFINTNTDTIFGKLQYFYTNLNPLISIPLFESFEDSIFPSNGWMNLADSSWNTPWARSSSSSKTGNYSAFREYWNSSWLVSPRVKIEDNYDTLSFWYSANTYNNEQNGKLSVYISDTCDFSSYRDISNIILYKEINSNTNGWVNLKIPLTNFINKKVYIGIKYDSWTYQLYLDDISGILYADSLKTVTPSIDTVDFSSAKLYWESLNANQWRLQLAFDSLGWDNKILDTILSDTNILISNLQPLTNYKARLKADYGDNIASSWSNTIQFTTLDNVSIKNTSLSKTSLSITPNPAKNQTTINIENIFGEVNISIYNINGVIVKAFNEKTNGSLNKTIELESFEEGVYFVRIENKGEIKTEKLIKK